MSGVPLRRVWIWEGDDYTYHVSPDDTAYQYGFGYFTDEELSEFRRVERDFAWMQQKIHETIAHPDTRVNL